MSGKTKRILFRSADLILLVAAYAFVAWIAASVFVGYRGWDAVFAFFGVLLCVALRIPAAVHELGHLLFGLFAGMKCEAVTLSYLRIGGGKVRLVNPAYAGAVEAFPKSGEHVREKFLCMTVGGAAFNVLAGGALLAPYLLIPFHPALFFCGMLAPLMFYEGISALLPAELPAGKTDGAVLAGLLKNAPEEDVLIRVMTAQGILYRGDFSMIGEELLSGAPVVREDLPAYHALLMLRMQALLAAGNQEGAAAVLGRLGKLTEYLSAEAKDDLARYGAYFEGNFTAKESKLAGVTRLEEGLAKNEKILREAES